MKTLIIAEKPSVARDLALVLDSKKKAQGYLAGQEYDITWCFGHMLGLANPPAYGWKKWELGTLPLLPKPFELSPKADKLDHLNILKSLLHPAITNA